MITEDDGVNGKLSLALSQSDFKTIEALKYQLKLTENSQNIIHLMTIIASQSNIQIINELSYLYQFYPQMNEEQQNILDEISKWIFLKQIYQIEVSPPVRILQREELYLAQSNIDFNLCQNTNNEKKCANNSREKLHLLMTSEEIKRALKAMATKDPCVNLTKHMQNQKKANLCLMKSQGKSIIELIPMPLFTTDQWQKVLEE